MKQYVLENRKGILTVISICQIIGSLVMFYLTYMMANREFVTVQYLVLFLLLAIAAVSLFAGVLYLVYGECTRFFLLSKLNLGLQILQLSVAGFKFSFFYGAYLSIGMDEEINFLVNFELLTAYFNFHLGSTGNYFVKLNLVPILPLVILWWTERNPAKKEDDPENAFLEDEPAQ